MPGAPRLPRRILVVRLSALGDILVALPVLDALRRGLPGIHLSLAVQDEFAPLLEGHPALDAVVPVPMRRWRRALRNPLRWPSLMTELRRFDATAGHPDCVVDVHGNLKSGLVAWWTGAPMRIGPGPGEAREGNALFMTHRGSRPPTTRRHRVLRALSVLAPLGLPAELPLPETPPLAHLVPSREARDAERRVLLHPGTSPRAAFKRWPTARFGELARELAEPGRIRVEVVGGPGEEALVAEVVEASEGAATSLPTPAGLRELARTLGTADLFVGADSGPACMADACGVPTLTLFGPKDPLLYGPRRGLAVRRAVACGPCGLRRCPLPEVTCMVAMDAREVAAAARELLAGRVPPEAERLGLVRVLEQAHMQ